MQKEGEQNSSVNGSGNGASAHVETEPAEPNAQGEQTTDDAVERILAMVGGLRAEPSESAIDAVEAELRGLQAELAGAGEDTGEDASRANGSGLGGAEEESLEELAKKHNELNDQYLRALAEVENVRKISERERLSAAKFGATGLARDVLPVHDNLKRALASADDAQKEHSGALIDGVELTLKELLKALGRHGISPVMPSRGEDFDPNLHQAVFEAPVPDVEAGKIVEMIAEGFTIHNRLLRAAQVGVSSYRPESEEPAE